MPEITFTHRMSRLGVCFPLLNRDVFAEAGFEGQGLEDAYIDARRSGLFIGMLRSPGEVSGGTEVVVKFTAEYNADAHAALVRHKLAPTLHACVPVCGGLKMVVMDRVKGKTARVIGANGEELLPSTVYDDVKKAIEVLHESNFVFGDLRPNNIMCVSSDDGRMGGVLVDFDWVGQAGVSRYPTIFNDVLPDFHPGARRYTVMQKEHDTYSLLLFKKLCSTASA